MYSYVLLLHRDNLIVPSYLQFLYIARGITEHPIEGIKYTYGCVLSMVKLNASISAIDHYLFRRLITEHVVTHSTSSVTADEIISLFTALSSRKPKSWPTWWNAGDYRSSGNKSTRERAHNELRLSRATQQGNKSRALEFRRWDAAYSY